MRLVVIRGDSDPLLNICKLIVLLFPVLFASCAERADEVDNDIAAKFAYLLLASAGTSDNEGESDGSGIYSYSFDPVSGMPTLIGRLLEFSSSDISSYTVSKSGKSLFVVTKDGLIATFSIVEDTSLVYPVASSFSAVLQDFEVRSIVLHPLGRFIYIVLSIDDPDSEGKISIMEIYSVDPKTGLATFRGAQQAVVGSSQFVFSEDGNNAYGARIKPFAGDGPPPPPEGILTTYDVDRITGFMTAIDSLSFNGWAFGGPFHPIALDPTGKFLYLTPSSGFCDSDPGPGTVWEQTGSIVYTYIIDPSTGLLTNSGEKEDVSKEIINWGATHPSGDFVYFLSAFDFEVCGDFRRVPNTIYAYYVNRSTGELFLTGREDAGIGGKSITVDPTGKYLYLLNPNDIFVYNIDQATGSLQAIGTPLRGATAIPLAGPALSLEISFIGF
ncbi:MAG: beta-propeller fold lactonase family protein [SAR324 cluster bacterium]|nr:beta-propeller fold lactonase family protein [SAR324 cluster bacterium]